MTFADPQALVWLLAVLPLMAGAGWALGVARRRRERLLGSMADALAPGFSAPRRLARDGLALLALALLIVALAGPQVGTSLRKIEERGVDVMVVLDTSRSMLADDMRPTRLERAKREIRGLLENMVGDRVGLVAFSGDARRVCPLTHDATTFRMFLDDVDTMTNTLGGTAIGEGLELALDSFDDEYPSESVIILMTDGEDHTSDPPPTQVAYEARARGIPVHVVSFGTEEGGTIRVLERPGHETVVRDADGQPVLTRPNEELLESIAGIADGAFLSADRTPFPLDELYTKRILVMDGISRSSTQREEPIDRYQYVLALALVCLGVRALVRDGRLS